MFVNERIGRLSRIFQGYPKPIIYDHISISSYHAVFILFYSLDIDYSHKNDYNLQVEIALNMEGVTSDVMNIINRYVSVF